MGGWKNLDCIAPVSKALLASTTLHSVDNPNKERLGSGEEESLILI